MPSSASLRRKLCVSLLTSSSETLRLPLLRYERRRSQHYIINYVLAVFIDLQGAYGNYLLQISARILAYSDHQQLAIYSLLSLALHLTGNLLGYLHFHSDALPCLQLTRRIAAIIASCACKAKQYFAIKHYLLDNYTVVIDFVTTYFIIYLYLETVKIDVVTDCILKYLRSGMQGRSSLSTTSFMGLCTWEPM